HHNNVFFICKTFTVAFSVCSILREIVDAEHNVLGRSNAQLTVGRRNDVVYREHEKSGFYLSFQGHGDMNSHLVSVEISVKSRADKGVQPDCPSLDQYWVKSL